MWSRALSISAGALLLAWTAAAQDADRIAGEEACQRCHAETHAKWRGSRHSKMVQPATTESVRGDFRFATIRLRGREYGLRTEGGRFYMTETYFGLEPREHEVLYTLGNRRIQHYLTRLPNGRIVVLPPSWDVLRREWFLNLDIAAPDQQEGGALPVQVWNKNCFGCHVSGEVKGYDADDGTYATEWVDFGTTCERCHGSGVEHVNRYQSGSSASGGGDIVVPTELDPFRSTMICAQCHSFRDEMVSGFEAGDDYFDHFFPLLEYSSEPSSDPTWYRDGKTRRFSTNALAIWQSECFIEGELACTSCHTDAHAPEIESSSQLRADNRALCTRCHERIASDVAAHTFHGVESRGSDCVECHMPRSVVSIKAKIRDHSISIPAPENTIHHGIPNACNLCHDDRSPRWTLEALERWYPGSRAREKLVKRADAFQAARDEAPDAIRRLLDVLADPRQGPLPRANALGYLGRSQDARVYPALANALDDPHPLVRSIAALGLGRVPDRYRGAATNVLVGAVTDERATVRMNAAISLLNLGVRALRGAAGSAFEEAKRAHVERGEFHSDDGPQQMNLGRFHLLNGSPVEAARAFENSYALAPDQPGIGFLMAVTRLSQKRPEEAKALLEDVAAEDPFATPARELLRELQARQR